MSQVNEENDHECAVREAEETINELVHRTNALQRRINSPHLPDSDKMQAKEDLRYIKRVLDKNKELLVKMKKKDRKPMLLISILVFLCFFCYSMYVLFYGS